VIDFIQPPCIFYTIWHFDKKSEKLDVSNTNLKKDPQIPCTRPLRSRANARPQPPHAPAFSR